jgi:hypothetical protein
VSACTVTVQSLQVASEPSWWDMALDIGVICKEELQNPHENPNLFLRYGRWSPSRITFFENSVLTQLQGPGWRPVSPFPKQLIGPTPTTALTCSHTPGHMQEP